MVMYQLPNGKTVGLSIEKFLDLTDEDIQYLMSIDAGVEINDPFHFKEQRITGPIVIEGAELEELPPEVVEEIKKEIENED